MTGEKKVSKIGTQMLNCPNFTFESHTFENIESNQKMTYFLVKLEFRKLHFELLKVELLRFLN